MCCRELAAADSDSKFFVNCASQASYDQQPMQSAPYPQNLDHLDHMHQPQSGAHIALAKVLVSEGDLILQEYFKAIKVAKLDYPMYIICFPGASVHAKAAR